ncbi:MAG: acetyl-CoA C-acetyltransferase [Acidobacteriota bacterium]
MSTSSSLDQAVILSACRTPIGRFQGALKDLPATRLGSLAIEEAVRRSGVDADRIGEVIMGNVLSAGLGQAPARQAALGAGLSESVGALTVNKVCGSGLKAVSLAANAVALGESEVVVAGGMESMTRAPYLAPGVRSGLRMGDGQFLDSMVHDGLWDPYDDHHMGMTGEIVAERWEVSREQQDQWAFDSHRKAVAAVEAGEFKAEIVPVELKGRKGDSTLFETDEGPRADTKLEKLSSLRAVFKRDGGTVTAGNASTINDGASAVVVTSERKAQEWGFAPMARIVASATHGLAPELVMMAPEGAIRTVVEKAGWTLDQVDLFEINEAFAVQQCALGKVLEIPEEKHNVRGGAVALGHPIGASGARCLTTLLHCLKDREASRGVVSLCLGGGNAVAMAVEMVR